MSYIIPSSSSLELPSAAFWIRPECDDALTCYAILASTESQYWTAHSPQQCRPLYPATSSGQLLTSSLKDLSSCALNSASVFNEVLTANNIVPVLGNFLNVCRSVRIMICVASSGRLSCFSGASWHSTSARFVWVSATCTNRVVRSKFVLEVILERNLSPV